MLSSRMDYHLHTAVTVDATMSETEVCERAVAAGVDEICFTNHSMLTEPDYNISIPDMIQHWRNIQECQHRYPELTIRLGLELNYHPDREVEIEAAIRRYEEAIGRRFDMVLGAVHHLNGVFFAEQFQARQLYERKDVLDLFDEYFLLSARAVRSGLYDVIAHPDLIKKYTDIYAPRVPFSAYADSAGTFVEALITCNVGMELNTKGLTFAMKEIYPSDDLLGLYIREAKARGVEPVITVGSDAHKATDVAARLASAAAALHRVGHTEATLFECRQRIPCCLRE